MKKQRPTPPWPSRPSAQDKTTGPIPVGQQRSLSFTVPNLPGAYLYYDNLNDPVHRVMGLHGAIVVMPTGANAEPFNMFTPPGYQQQFWGNHPYNATVMGALPNVTALFNALGNEIAAPIPPSRVWPGTSRGGA